MSDKFFGVILSIITIMCFVAGLRMALLNLPFPALICGLMTGAFLIFAFVVFTGIM